jgi:hypothetical protein
MFRDRASSTKKARSQSSRKLTIVRLLRLCVYVPPLGTEDNQVILYRDDRRSIICLHPVGRKLRAPVAAGPLDDINSDTINCRVPTAIDKLLRAMRANPNGVAFSDVTKVAEHFFGAGRQTGGSHLVFKMPWAGDPRINLQKGRGGAKPYQVRQLLQAVDKLTALRSSAVEIEITEPGVAKQSTDAKRTGRRNAEKKSQGNG